MSDEKACYCDSRQCDICTPPKVDETDWKAVAISLGEMNRQLLEIGLSADSLADQLQRYITACTTPSRTVSPDYSLSKLKAALDAFKVVRQRQ